MSKDNGFVNDDNDPYEYPEWAKEFFKDFSERHPGMSMFKEGQNPYEVFDFGEMGLASTAAETSEPPPLTAEIMQEAIDSCESSYAPAMPEIVYSELVEYDVSYEELKFIPVYPCQMEIVKIGEEREYPIWVIDESKMAAWASEPEAPVFPYVPLFNPFGHIGGPPRSIDFQIPFPRIRREPHHYIVAHPSAREEIEAMLEDVKR